MTYRPVENPDPRRGKPPLPIPPTLLAQLQHTYDTGCKAEADLTDIPYEDVDELRRTLIRAGYRAFPGKSVRSKFSNWPYVGPDGGRPTVTFWLADKQPARRPKTPTTRRRKTR